MAQHITAAGKIDREIEVPLTLTRMQTLVGGFIRFVCLPNDDLMVVNEAHLDGAAPFNSTASALAGKLGPIHGDVILCSPEEIA